MGSICQNMRKGELENYHIQKDDKISQQQRSQGSLHKNINHITFVSKYQPSFKADCLMVFVDEQCQILNNECIKKVSPSASDKVQQSLDSVLKRSAMNIGDFTVIKIKQILPFKYLAVMCMENMTGGTSILMPLLKDDIDVVLQELVRKSINRLIISQIGREFGIPIHIARKQLCRSVLERKNEFEGIVVLCQEQSEAQLHKETFQKEYKNLEVFLSKSEQI